MNHYPAKLFFWVQIFSKQVFFLLCFRNYSLKVIISYHCWILPKKFLIQIYFNFQMAWIKKLKSYGLIFIIVFFKLHFYLIIKLYFPNLKIYFDLKPRILLLLQFNLYFLKILLNNLFHQLLQNYLNLKPIICFFETFLSLTQ